MHPRAAHLLNSLALEPHPEGGHYRRCFTSKTVVEPADGRGPRPALTAIHFLLAAGEHGRWHRVASDETWLYAEGDGLRLHTLDWHGRELCTVRLGSAGPGTVPVHVVPAGTWQAAEPEGAYALVRCLVAPGFDFADFELMARDGPEARWLAEATPALIQL